MVQLSWNEAKNATSASLSAIHDTPAVVANCDCTSLGVIITRNSMVCMVYESCPWTNPKALLSSVLQDEFKHR
jgi:hypothetical protein